MLLVFAPRSAHLQTYKVCAQLVALALGKPVDACPFPLFVHSPARLSAESAHVPSPGPHRSRQQRTLRPLCQGHVPFPLPDHKGKQ